MALVEHVSRLHLVLALDLFGYAQDFAGLVENASFKVMLTIIRCLGVPTFETISSLSFVPDLGLEVV